jgi:hypothetical protein
MFINEHDGTSVLGQTVMAVINPELTVIPCDPDTHEPTGEPPYVAGGFKSAYGWIVSTDPELVDENEKNIRFWFYFRDAENLEIVANEFADDPRIRHRYTCSFVPTRSDNRNRWEAKQVRFLARVLAKVGESAKA